MKIKKKSQRQEKDIAKSVGGNVVVASGALWGAKGDVRTDDYLIEAKTTSKDFYTLNVCTWEKIENEAIIDNGRIPLMVVDLRDGEDRLVVFKVNDFEDTNEIRNVLRKSIRIKALEDGISQRLFVMCGSKQKHNLCCMWFDDFSKQYMRKENK